MLNGKFKCIKTSDERTMLEGRIYEFKDGVFEREDGRESCNYTSVKEFHDSNFSYKIELVELQQPHKSLLKSGDKVVYRDKDVRFVLLETESLYNEEGHLMCNLKDFSDELKWQGNYSGNDIMEIWRGDELIAKRIEKSANEIEIERIKNEMLKLSEQQNQLAKDLEKLEK